MANFFSNLFTIRRPDGTVSKTTIAGWAGAVLAALATVPGGPAFLSGAIASAGPYAPLILAVLSVASGAAINHETSAK